MLFRQETLRAAPLVVACFVEPAQKATNSMTGVFLLGKTPVLQFVFTGIGIGPDPRSRGVGYRPLIGNEHASSDVWTESLFVWNGRNYALKSTRDVKPGARAGGARR